MSDDTQKKDEPGSSEPEKKMESLPQEPISDVDAKDVKGGAAVRPQVRSL